jgi:hypothetical protein
MSAGEPQGESMMNRTCRILSGALLMARVPLSACKRVGCWIFPLIAACFLAVSAACAESGPIPMPPSPPRPGADAGPTKISILAWFADISKIDSVAESCSANLVIVMRWHDARLAREGSETKCYALSDIWHPRWIVANESDSLKRSFPETVDVTPDGTVIYRQRLIGAFSQALRLHRFPFDHDTFRVHLVVAGMRPDEIEFVPDAAFATAGMPEGVGMAKSLTIQDWQVNAVAAHPRPYVVAPGIEIAGYSLEFSADRLVQHYLLKVILPLILIVLMSWMVFWIDPSNGSSQISVAVTSMLTLIAYRFAVGADVPKLPYLTRLDAFILMSSLLVFASLVEVMITTKWAGADRLESARRMDRVCRWIFPLVFAIITGAVFLR